MKTLALLLVSLSAHAGTLQFFWQPPDEPTNAVAAYKLMLATNGAPWHSVWLTKATGITNQLAPGMWRIGWQTLGTNGTTSELHTIGFRMEAPEVPKPVEYLTVLNVLQEADLPNGPRRDFAAYAMQVPTVDGSKKFYFSTSTIVPLVVPGQPGLLQTNAPPMLPPPLPPNP